MSDKQEDNKQSDNDVQFGTCAVSLWQHQGTRKDLRRLETLLEEFASTLAGAQGRVEEHVLPEFEDRLRDLHASNIAAIARVQTLVTCAANGGVILVPDGWLSSEPPAVREG